MKLQSFIILLILFIVGTVLVVPSVNANSKDHAQNGVYSIQHFPENEFIQLDGKWEFYWHKLYTPADFNRNTVQEMPQMVDVPVGSNGYNLGGGKISSTGYATYRLHIKFPEEEVGTTKALYLPSISSAYTLWIDGEVKASSGKVGKSIHSNKPGRGQKIVQFQVHSHTMELVIQNSNYEQRKAGIFEPILIGEPDVLYHYHEGRLLFRAVSVASLVMIGLYHVALFAFRRKERSLIFFGFLCFLIAMRTILLEDALALHFLPFLSWELSSKLEYFGATCGMLFLSLFTYTQFTSDMSRKVRNVIIFVTSMYSLFVLVVPVMVSTKAINWIQAMIYMIFLYLIYVHAKVFIRKRNGAFLNAIGIFILFIAIINDTFKYNGLVYTTELTSVGLVFYLFIQSIIISKNYSMSFERSDQLTKDLSILNASLEEKVQIRTEELNQSNQHLQIANQQLNKAQQSKSKLINNISHEIGSPLTIIRAYTKGMMDGIIESDPQYIELVYDKSIYLSKILDDLVALSDIENRQIKFDLERVDIREFSKKLFKKHQLVIEKKEISFKYKDSLTVEENNPFVLIDVIRIEQVIVNLLTNAQRFVDENGKIILELAKEDEHHIVIKVIDNGIGIKEDDIPFVFDRFYSNSNNGKKHNGSGLGLAISKEIVEYHKGRIWVKSRVGEGTYFCFTLPIIKD